MTTPCICQSLIYVSRNRLDRPDQDFEIADIIEVSQSRNAQLFVTGALIATYQHFAQVLEGPAESLDALMDSIAHDSRHDNITVICREKLDEKRFPDWSMAYSGPAGYVDRHIAPLFAEADYPDRGPDIERLLRLFKAFAAPSGREPNRRPESGTGDRTTLTLKS